MRGENLAGRIFERLTVLSRVGVGLSGHIKWLCKCECGKEIVTESRYLKHGGTKSCGCLYNIGHATNLQHGMSQTSEYRTWAAMKQRCLDTKSEFYPAYGGRGISICDEWLSLERFVSDMGPRPSPTHTIERIDNDGNYTPENCKWATREEQCNNKRTSVKLKINGEVKTVSQWSKLFGWNPKAIYYRIKQGRKTSPQRRRRRNRDTGRVMSKESEAKKRQGYFPKVIPRVCMNCSSFRSEIVEKTQYGSTWKEEKNLRCAIGGFAVKKMGACDRFSGKE